MGRLSSPIAGLQLIVNRGYIIDLYEKIFCKKAINVRIQTFIAFLYSHINAVRLFVIIYKDTKSNSRFVAANILLGC